MIFGRTGIRVHILLTVVGVLVAGFAVIHSVSTPLFENALTEQRLAQDKWLANSIARDLVARSTSRAQALEFLSTWENALEGVCLALVGDKGQILGQGSRRLALCAGRAQVEQVAALKNDSHRLIDRAGTQVLAVVASMRNAASSHSKLAGLSLVYVSTIQGVGQLRVIPGVFILLFMLLTVALVALLGYTVLTQLIVRPVGRLLNTMDRVTSGDLEARAELSGGREIRSLNQAFNRLVETLAVDEARIQAQINELQHINQKLEQTTDNLVQSEKMASVGRLAAGVAHEIGNPVSIVQGYMEMMKRKDVSIEEMNEWVSQSSAAIDRVDVIIRDLLDFSRPSVDNEPHHCDLNAAIEQTLSLLRPQESFQHLEVTTSLGDEQLLGAISEKRFQQVLVNILLNAAAATLESAGGGTVHFEMKASDTLVELSISDNGPGLTDEAQRHLFEPFFSTKEPGQGTGLGLSICYSIMTACGGNIRVVNSTDPGCTFVLLIPRVQEA